MNDPFATTSPGLAGPAAHAFAVTPDDAADLPVVTRGLYVGTGGDISLVLKGESAPVSFVGVPAGSMLPLRVLRLRATGTTANDMLGLY
ncbi:MAG TPA: hypothetical protein VKA19_15585 [Alphaproteobacteria bacterium]|nr:hypothetical protein [Alphaproteobacteria bacterium]